MRCRDYPVLLLAAAVLTAPRWACADQQGATKLGEVVVTATKTEVSSADAPAAVSVVTAGDIQDMNVHSADEALTYLPGVYATRTGGHEPSVMSTNVMLRGIPDYSRTLVLVNGQPLNDPYIGAVTWESVPPETIDRIEVVPGPFSSLYGGSAMGGVINIITKVPARREALAKVGYGTGGLKSGTFVYQNRISALGLMFNYGYQQSDGYVESQVVRAPSGPGGTPVSGGQATTDPYGNPAYLIGDKGRTPWDSRNVGLNLYLDLPHQARLSFSASRFTYDKGWDRFHSYLRDAAGNPVSSGNVTLSGSGDNLALSQSLFLQGPNPKVQNRYGLEYNTPLGHGASLKAEFSYLDIPTYDYVIPWSGATYDGGGPGSRLHRPNSELSGSLQLSLPIAERHFLVAGVSAGKRKIETYTYAVSDWRNVDDTGVTQNRTAGEDRTYALFLQDEFYLSQRLTAYLGGRYDAWSSDGFIEQLKAPAYRNDYASRSQTHFSPKASLVYRPAPSTTLRASVGTAFHAPNLRDTFGWWTPASGKTYIPNPDLKPETVTSWEAGAEQRFGATLLRATYYENRLHDLIYRTEDATTQSVANAGAALVRGIELELRRAFAGGLSAFVNYTYNDARITSNPANPATEGKRMTGTPRNMLNVGMEGKRGPWSGSLTGHYVGKVYGNDQNLDTVDGVFGSYDPYFVVNAKAAYQVSKAVALSLALDNLLDRDYYQGSYNIPQGRAWYGEMDVRF